MTTIREAFMGYESAIAPRKGETFLPARGRDGRQGTVFTHSLEVLAFVKQYNAWIISLVIGVDRHELAVTFRAPGIWEEIGLP